MTDRRTFVGSIVGGFLASMMSRERPDNAATCHRFTYECRPKAHPRFHSDTEPARHVRIWILGKPGMKVER
jgi:hypothetical protein